MSNSFSFEVLSTKGDNASRWREMVENLPLERRDIHYLPEYSRIYEMTYGYEARLACLSQGDRYIMQPFQVRPLNGLPFLADHPQTGVFYDIANSYGYGGPLASFADDDPAAEHLFRLFVEQFSRYCHEQHFASEFTSLHPLLRNAGPLLKFGLERSQWSTLTCLRVRKRFGGG